jgi:hypothetical protein
MVRSPRRLIKRTPLFRVTTWANSPSCSSSRSRFLSSTPTLSFTPDSRELVAEVHHQIALYLVITFLAFTAEQTKNHVTLTTSGYTQTCITLHVHTAIVQPNACILLHRLPFSCRQPACPIHKEYQGNSGSSLWRWRAVPPHTLHLPITSGIFPFNCIRVSWSRPWHHPTLLLPSIGYCSRRQMYFGSSWGSQE